MAAAAPVIIPGWFYVDFHYGVEDWVQRFVYIAEEMPGDVLLFRVMRIERESPPEVRDGDDLVGVYRPLRGRRTGAGEWMLMEGWGAEPLELTHSSVLPTLEAVPA